MSGHEPKLTPAMISALEAASFIDGMNPWEFGSSTVAALKRCGFIVKRAGTPARYELTASGRAALEAA